MTPELKAMIEATAAKCNLTIADALRAIARGIVSGRPAGCVADIEKMKSATKSGTVVVNIAGGMIVPDMMSGHALRMAIYRRCMEELNRPERKNPQRAETSAIEGVDYNVPDVVAAAKLGLV